VTLFIITSGEEVPRVQSDDGRNPHREPRGGEDMSAFDQGILRPRDFAFPRDFVAAESFGFTGKAES